MIFSMIKSKPDTFLSLMLMPHFKLVFLFCSRKIERFLYERIIYSAKFLAFFICWMGEKEEKVVDVTAAKEEELW